MRRQIVFLSALLVAGVSRPVEACDPVPDFKSMFPTSGSSLPRNAGVLVGGYWGVMTGELPTASVDGAPATVVELESIGDPWQNLYLHGLGRVFRVEPVPPLGAAIAFTGFDVPIEFTAGSVDVTPPPALVDLFIDLHDFAPDYCGDDCQGPCGLNYWVSLVGGEQDDGSPVVYSVFVNDTGDGTDGIRIRTYRAGSKPKFSLPMPMGWEDGHDPLTDLCVTVRVFDTAMNEAPVAHRVCGPCRARIEPGGDPQCSTETEYWAEPNWLPGDALPNGQCTAMQIPPLPAQPLPPPDPEPDPETTGEPPPEDTDTTGRPPPDTDGPTTSADSTSTGDSPTTSVPGDVTTTGETGGPVTTGDGTGVGGTDGPATGGAPSDGDKGCACASNSSSRAPAWLLLLLALRRRARRGRAGRG
jgi:hypothetical protein